LVGAGGKSIGPSLTRLQDAVEMSQLFFYKVAGIQQGGGCPVEAGRICHGSPRHSYVDNAAVLTEASTQDIIKQVIKENLKGW